jgi:hypothetical protein
LTFSIGKELLASTSEVGFRIGVDWRWSTDLPAHSLAEEDWHAVLDLPLIQLPMRKYSGLCFLKLFSSEVPYEDSAQFCNLV